MIQTSESDTITSVCTVFDPEKMFVPYFLTPRKTQGFLNYAREEKHWKQRAVSFLNRIQILV